MECGKSRILIGCVYRLPDSRDEYANEIFDTIKLAKNIVQRDGFTSLILLGDFNFPDIAWSIDGPIIYANEQSIEQIFVETLQEQFLDQLVDFPTF